MTQASGCCPSPPSLPAGYQHEEGLQEQYHPGPAGGVADVRPQPRGGDVPPL